MQICIYDNIFCVKQNLNRLLNIGNSFFIIKKIKKSKIWTN